MRRPAQVVDVEIDWVSAIGLEPRIQHNHSLTPQPAELQYALIGKLWRRHWTGITPLFAYPEEIRRAIYTTNVVESLHRTLREVIQTRGSFPAQESALQLLYLASTSDS